MVIVVNVALRQFAGDVEVTIGCDEVHPATGVSSFMAWLSSGRI